MTNIPSLPLPTKRLEPRSAGFTMLEVLVVIVIIGLAMTAVIPNLLGELQKQRKQSFLGEVTNFMVTAKQEAARRGVAVIVQTSDANNQLFAFANVDNDGNLFFTPDATVPARTADYEVSHLELPTSGNGFLLDFWGADDANSRGTDMTAGMTEDGNNDRVFVFEADGSVRDIGAIRFGDINGDNFFEVRVAPEATGRIQVRKYNDSTDFGGPNYLPRGIDSTTDRNFWTWY